MPFLAPNQQHQSTEVVVNLVCPQFITMNVHLCLHRVCHDEQHHTVLSCTAQTCLLIIPHFQDPLFIIWLFQVFWPEKRILCPCDNRSYRSSLAATKDASYASIRLVNRTTRPFASKQQSLHLLTKYHSIITFFHKYTLRIQTSDNGLRCYIPINTK